MASGGMRQQIVELIAGLETLPTLPAVVTLLNKKLAAPGAKAADIARIIEDDPPLTSRVLRLLQSPVYAPLYNRQKTTVVGSTTQVKQRSTLQQAVVRMGINAVRDLVLTTSVLQALPGGGDDVSFDRTKFWKHSISCGLVAATLMQFMREKISNEQTEVMLAGLCHDLGKVILDQYFAEQFSDILRQAKREGRLMYEVEQELLHIEHGEVGGFLAERWELPASIRAAMSYHHRVDLLPPALSEHAPLVHVIKLADYITNHQNLGFSGNYRGLDFPRASFAELRLATTDIPEIIKRVREEAEKSEVLLALEQQ
ncbi:MAG: HDOD domain-containing protein [Planctomycetes bacterium]|nr:HDOD domain-containing protein [Planctomycetota bacterium]